MTISGPSTSLRGIDEARRDMYRQQILAAAEVEFSRAGFDEAKMTSIAQTAGVSLATVYKHFAGKEAVWEALHADRMRDLLAFVTARATPSSSPLDRLLDGVANVLLFLTDHPDYLELNLKEGVGWGASDIDDRADGNQRQVWAAGLDMITHGVIDAMDAGELVAVRPRIASAMIISALQVWLYDWARSERDRSAADVAEEMLHYLRRMLFPGP